MNLPKKEVDKTKEKAKNKETKEKEEDVKNRIRIDITNEEDNNVAFALFAKTSEMYEHREFLCPWIEKYPFVDDGLVFGSVKQYVQYKKAKIFADHETLAC